VGQDESSAGAGALFRGNGDAMGEKFPPRILIGRLLGRLAKKSMIVNEKPMPRKFGDGQELGGE